MTSAIQACAKSKIVIKMVSGETYEFYNNKHTTLQGWIHGNFNGEGNWFQISKERSLLLRFENMESVEFIKGSDKKEVKK